MVAILRFHRSDLAFVTGLLLLASIPLVVLRAFTELPVWAFQTGLWTTVGVAMVVLWAWQRSVLVDSIPTTPPANADEFTWTLSRWLFLAAVVLGITILNFFFPMRRHFWGGGDEQIMFTPWLDTFWSPGMDRFAGRPMALLQVGLAHLIWPDRIEGFLLIAVLLTVANALLLAGILAHCFRGDWLVPVAGAALYVVNPCDGSRFYVIWTSNCYWTAVLFLQLGAWLYLESAARGQRWLLVLSCLSLMAAAVSNEGLMPIACMAPVLLWLCRRHDGRLLPWAFAWYGMMGLLAARFIVHIKVDDAYQGRMANGVDMSWDALWLKTTIQLNAMWVYFDLPPGTNFWRGPNLPALVTLVAGAALVWRGRHKLATWTSGRVGFGAALLAVAATSLALFVGFQWSGETTARAFGPALVAAIFVAGCCFTSEGMPTTPGLARSGVGMVTAAVAALAGLLPYILILPHTFRSQFLAGPAQAGFLACGIGTLCACIPGRFRTGFAMACAVWLLAATTMNAWTIQDRTLREQAASFDRMVDVLDQVHALSPAFKPNTTLIFLIESHAESPAGRGAAVEFLGLHLFDKTRAMQVTVASGKAPAPGAPNAVFTEKNVFARAWIHGENKYDYRDVVLFQLGREGDVALLREIPEYLLPTNTAAAGYAPLSRMIPGPITPLPIYRFTKWSKVPHDVFDYRTGIRLGNGWGELRWSDGILSRWAQDGAEILINPAGETERTVTFVFEPSKKDANARLELIDEKNRVIATSSTAGEQTLSLPMQIDRINVFRLRLASSADEGPRRFRILRAGDPVPVHSKYATPEPIRRALCGKGVEMRNNWHVLEKEADGSPFHWADNNAELVVTSRGLASSLTLEIAPGPGLDGKPGELTVREKDGRILVTEVITERRTFDVPLPNDGRKSYELILTITNGGKRTNNDPRVLNFRAYRADLTN